MVTRKAPAEIASLDPKPLLAYAGAVAVGLAAIAQLMLGACIVGRTFHPWSPGTPSAAVSQPTRSNS
ncbi:MAG: hypothetical protein ACREEB_14425 [Caulobacteraceae bacterium]